ncbi:uncharacterized protein LOC134095994 isoform X1 [Sardina pilchardus]|uniref:uncharacterized protein LOC134095994 isoform X1 n=1 Tax=Sardina pilchardus TaxID=27697 RepID=UPI002E113FE6
MDLGHPVSSGCNVTETQQVDQTRVIIKEEDIQEEEYDQEDEEQPFAELHCRTETDVTESNASDNEAQQTTAEIEVKIEEDDEPDNSNLVESEQETIMRRSYNGREFFVPKDVEVCFLTDSICRDLEQYVSTGRCWVHDGTTLRHSLVEHVYYFRQLQKPAVVVLHIGTNDLAAGTSAVIMVRWLEALICRIARMCAHKLFFAVSSILPRPVDDMKTKHAVKACNCAMYRWTLSQPNVVFLQTWKAFVKARVVCEELYQPDKLHLNVDGKKRLFFHFQEFLRNFCGFKMSVGSSVKNKS